MLTRLTAEDLIDLGRWHFIQFASEEAQRAAYQRYREWVSASLREDARASLYPEPPV